MKRIKKKRMKILVFVNNNNAGLENLTSSIKKHNGWTMEKIYNDTKNQRMSHILTYMQEYTNLDELVIISHGHDVLCIRDYDESFEDKFKSFDTQIILLHDGNQKPSKGLMVGRIGDFLELYHFGNEKKFSTEKDLLSAYMSEYPNKICVDTNHLLFLNDMYGTTNYKYNENDHSITYNDKTITPYFIHFQKLNRISSISILNLFDLKKIFEVGQNYNTIGKKISGSEHITNFSPDCDTFVTSVWIERAIVFFLIVFFFAGMVVLLANR